MVCWGTDSQQVCGFPAEFLLLNQILTSANATSFTDLEWRFRLFFLTLWLSSCEGPGRHSPFYGSCFGSLCVTQIYGLSYIHSFCSQRILVSPWSFCLQYSSHKVIDQVGVIVLSHTASTFSLFVILFELVSVFIIVLHRLSIEISGIAPKILTSSTTLGKLDEWSWTVFLLIFSNDFLKAHEVPFRECDLYRTGTWWGYLWFSHLYFPVLYLLISFNAVPCNFLLKNMARSWMFSADWLAGKTSCW